MLNSPAGLAGHSRQQADRPAMSTVSPDVSSLITRSQLHSTAHLHLHTQHHPDLHLFHGHGMWKELVVSIVLLHAVFMGFLWWLFMRGQSQKQDRKRSATSGLGAAHLKGPVRYNSAVSRARSTSRLASTV